MRAPQKDLENRDIRFAKSDEASVPDHEPLDMHFTVKGATRPTTDGSTLEKPALVLGAVKKLLPDLDETWVFPKQNVVAGFAADVCVHPPYIEVS
jgi:hypothetical protein